MLLIKYVGNICIRSLTDGHLGRHLEYFKTFNDALVASVGFINYNASTTRINKDKNFKIKFQVILVFYRTIGPISDYKKKLVTKINTYTLSTTIGKNNKPENQMVYLLQIKKSNLESIPTYLLYHVQQQNFKDGLIL